MKRIKWIIAISSVLLVQCSGSSVLNAWKSSEALHLQSGRIIVVGLTKESDQLLLQKMENHLADDLCNLGYDAVPFTELYHKKAEGQDEKHIIRQLQQNGANAVLTIVLLNKQKEKYHIPQSMLGSNGIYNNDFDIYYAAIYNKIYEDGYYINDTYYFWESNFFIMPEQKLIYSVQTQSFNPSSTTSLAHQYGKLIISNMLEHNVIKDTRK